MPLILQFHCFSIPPFPHFNSTVFQFQFNCFPISITLLINSHFPFPGSMPPPASGGAHIPPGYRTIYRAQWRAGIASLRAIVHDISCGIRAVCAHPRSRGPTGPRPNGLLRRKLGWARPKTRVGAAKNSGGRGQKLVWAAAKAPRGGPLGPSEASPAFPLEPPRGPPETPRDPPWAPWAPRRGAVTTFSTPAHHFCARPRLGRLPPGAPPGAPGDSGAPAGRPKRPGSPPPQRARRAESGHRAAAHRGCVATVPAAGDSDLSAQGLLLKAHAGSAQVTNFYPPPIRSTGVYPGVYGAHI